MLGLRPDSVDLVLLVLVGFAAAVARTSDLSGCTFADSAIVAGSEAVAGLVAAVDFVESNPVCLKLAGLIVAGPIAD